MKLNYPLPPLPLPDDLPLPPELPDLELLLELGLYDLELLSFLEVGV